MLPGILTSPWVVVLIELLCAEQINQYSVKCHTGHSVAPSVIEMAHVINLPIGS